MNFSVFLFPLLSSVITSLLTLKLKVNSIRASCSVSFFLILIFKNYSEASILIYGGSFVGMTMIKKFSLLEVVLASLGFSLLFILLDFHNQGVGGSLGLYAFLSVSGVLLLKKAAGKPLP